MRAFDAAARHLSFKRAAFEIGLTPTAVSHQIKQLEQLCDKPLFVRHTRKVSLTRDGVEFAKAISPAIDAMVRAYALLCEPADRQHVTLGAGPIFSARWLVPKLADFWQNHPTIDLRLHHSPVPVWRQMAKMDLAVAWGKGDWLDVVCDPLLQISLSPVLAPSLMADKAPLKPHDLLHLPLLHQQDDRQWRQWFRTAGVKINGELPGTVLEDANVLLQAALAGHGAALGIVEFTDDEVSSGRLIRPFQISIDGGDAYHLICTDDALTNEATAAVRRWMLGHKK